jgi:hypothetical protein
MNTQSGDTGLAWRNTYMNILKAICGLYASVSKKAANIAGGVKIRMGVLVTHYCNLS